MTNEIIRETEMSRRESIPEANEPKQKICFVCTGNTCRSPMAEAVLNFLGNGKYFAVSAGTAARDGDTINERSLRALEKAGILPCPERDYREHKAIQLDELICEACDRIITMTEGQYSTLFMTFPSYRDKLSVMSREIPDPFMCSQEIYDKTLEEITLSIKEMFSI